MRVILLPPAAASLDEYRRLLARYAIAVDSLSSVPEPRVLHSSADSSYYITERQWFSASTRGRLSPHYTGPITHYCQLAVTRSSGTAVPGSRLLFTGAAPGLLVSGAIQASAADSGSEVQDPLRTQLARFRLPIGTLSARTQALSAFAATCLQFSQPRSLAWNRASSAPRARVRRSVAAFVSSHPLLRPFRLRHFKLDSLIASSVNGGVYFRAPRSRRDRNYWLPGLNGGIPYTPKGDLIHELTYLVHDLMHHLMPDLLFTGDATALARRCYIAARMISEACSLALADMLFVDTLRTSGIAYDFTQRRILPLYDLLGIRPTTLDVLKDFLWEITRLCVLGIVPDIHTDDRDGVVEHFLAKYVRYFAADFEWTAVNWDNMRRHSSQFLRWHDLLGTGTLRRLDLDTTADALASSGCTATLDDHQLVERVFGYIFDRRLAPAWNSTPRVQRAKADANAFRRFMAGQLFAAARFEPLVGLPSWVPALLPILQGQQRVTARTKTDLRASYRRWLISLERRKLITRDDCRVYADAFPVFDPYYLPDYEHYHAPATIQEAAAAAFRTQ